MDNQNRNILDKYWNWTNDLIKEDVVKHTFPYAVLMQNFDHDFNIACLIRNANFLGAKKIYYFSDTKKYNKKPTVGTHHYSCIEHLATLDKVKELQKEYTFIGIENNIDIPTIDIRKFNWPKNPLMIFGSESEGIRKEILSLCTSLVEIPTWGSVRSMNVASTSAICMFDYINKHSLNISNRS